MPSFGTKVIATGTAVATSSTGTTPVNLVTPPSEVVFTLDVTSAATAAGDTLDVTVQTLIGAQWIDVVRFTQVLGNGGAKCHVMKIALDQAQATFENATSLTAGTLRNLFGDQWRAKWTVASASAPLFTFTVNAIGN